MSQSFKSIAFLLIAGSLLILSSEPAAVCAQPSAPTPLSPANGTITTVDNYPPLGVPEFRWNPVADATRYRIQFSQDISFASKFEIITPNTRYTPPNAGSFSDGTWYWRVRVDAPSPPSDYSSTMSFTKQWASSGNNPTLLSPDDNATLDFFEKPDFSWEYVMGAADYRLQIASSADGFNNPIRNWTTIAPTYQPTEKLSNGTYYWRVIPRDPSGREGTPSEVRKLIVDYDRAPTLLEPANASQPSFTPAFRWEAVRGAQYYRLQYSTDPAFQSGVNQIDTRSTTYTPYSALANDTNFYWRVKAFSNASVTDWSADWSFIKKWYTQTVLLTPRNNYQHTNPPFFSWTPVPGARSYKIEVSDNTGFAPLSWSAETANTFYVRPGFIPVSGIILYWRVTPRDGNGNQGKPSAVSSFKGDTAVGVPQLVYPFYYYSYEDPSLAHLQIMQPREDRTVPVPVFMWQRELTPTNSPPNEQMPAYRIQVDDDPLFGSLNWTFDTENLSAAPTVGDPFTPTTGIDYYWRVRPLDGLGGTEIGEWSQKWRTRIDASQGLTPTTSLTPTLLRPPRAAEFVETTPLLEWWPMASADSYQVEINTDPGFGAAYVVHTATVPYAAYTPPTHLDYYPQYTSTITLPFGTYYWRVRGRSGGSPVGNWSNPWRFQVAAQSRWRESRTLGENQLLIGSDPAGDAATDYDLTNLYAAQDKDYWYFGFNAFTDTTTMEYALYLDLDHEEGSGATFDEHGHDVTAIAAHRPEFAIYVRQHAGSLDNEHVYIYGWTGSAWGTPATLYDVGGSLFYTATTGYLEIMVPNTAIGMQDTTNSAAISLFSVDSESNARAQDSAPSDPDVDGGAGATLSRFASVSERLNLATPPTDVTGDPTTFPSMPPLFWHLPVDTQCNGYNLVMAVDEEFTTPAVNYSDNSVIPAIYTRDNDVWGDNTYYWRVRPRWSGSSGAWSQAGRFERSGFMAQNLENSVDFATPTFSWDMVEGAQQYRVEVDDDPRFKSVNDAATTKQNTHTPQISLPKGKYYWRVRVERYGSIENNWSYTDTFTLDLPRPTGLNHEPAGVTNRAPTLCWTPIVTPTNHPILAAYKYRIAVSEGDPTFSTLYDSAETEQSCWTPIKGYKDGTYYWHVAMRDGNSNLGDYSTAVTFTKQYPITTLISPTTGSQIAETPTFVWTPVDGAAQYRLEVSLYENFGVLYDSATTNNSRYTPSKEYGTGENYYWRVAMIDKNGNYGPFNTADIILDPYPYHIYLPLVIRG